MAAPTNHWKLGAFIVVGMAAVFVTVIALGRSEFDRVVVPFVTYFDEPVDGLKVGNAVQFRGVTIGEVKDIRVAPDRRHVEVICEVDVNQLQRLGLRPAGGAASPTGESDGGFVPPDLRAQLVSGLLTGAKTIQIDFFKEESHPPPGLPFPTPDNYIPATASTLKSIQEPLTHTLDKAPATMARVMEILASIQRLLAEMEKQKLPTKTVDTIDSLKAMIEESREKVADLKVKELNDKALAALDEANKALAKSTETFDRLNKQDGVIENLERSTKRLDEEMKTLKPSQTLRKAEATMAKVDKSLKKVDRTIDAYGDIARDSKDVGRELTETLVEVKAVAKSLRRLADMIERDSDSFLKGRARPKR